MSEQERLSTGRANDEAREKNSSASGHHDDAERLRPHVQALVRAVDEGREIGVEDLVPVFGAGARGLSPPELDEIRKFVVSRLNRFPLAVRIEFVVELVLENRENFAKLVARGVEARRRGVAKLFEAAEKGTGVPFEARVVFGARSRYHVQVLRDAIRDGRLSRENAEAVTNDGAGLNRILGDRSRVSIPVTFRTAGEQAPLEEPVLREPLLVRTSVGTFRVLVSNDREFWLASWLETDLMAWLENTLEEDSVLYDVGANIGLYSLYAARRQPGVHVVAFEPHPMNHTALVHNILLNQFDQILPFPVALSDRTGVTTFGCTFVDSGSAGHTGIDAHAGGARGVRMDFETAQVLGSVVYTLDDFVRSADFLKRPTHLKIDVDGPELQVVRGAREVLGDPGLRHLFIETAGSEQTEQIIGLLETYGFRHTAGNRTAGNQVFARG